MATTLLSLAGILGSGAFTIAAGQEGAEAVVGDYEVLSGRRVGRTVFEYVFRATLTNLGQSNPVRAAATLTGAGANVQILDGSLSFGGAPPGVPVTSVDTFVLRINRRRRFDPDALVWQVELGAEFEEIPGWRIPDLAVSSVTVDPERAAPGAVVTLRATVANVGRAGAPPATVVFLVDGTELERAGVGALERGEQAEVEVLWAAQGAGRHWIVAELALGDETVDRMATNNAAAAVARVSGAPVPALEFGDIDLDALALVPGQPAVIPIPVRNPSFVPITDLPVFFLIDGAPAGTPVSPPDSDVIGDLLPDAVINLAPGESERLQIPWSEVTPGQHVVQVVLDLPPGFEAPDLEGTRIWQLPVPGSIPSYGTPGKGRWASIGPQLIDLPPITGHTHFGSGRSVGRVDRIAFHPTNPSILYATAPRGGIWKSANAGATWSPIGDGLATLNARALAVDPGDPRIVYVATFADPGGMPIRGGTKGYGIYKSVDGGASWIAAPFVSLATVGVVSELVIRRPAAGGIVIYAAGSLGLLRYRSTKPDAMSSDPSEWQTLLPGEVSDLAVHPTNPDILYASQPNLLWRSRNGGDGWDRVFDKPGMPLFVSGITKRITLDVWKKDPRTLFAAVTNPFGQPTQIDPLPGLGLYVSRNEGDTWTFIDTATLSAINVFLKVHPTQPILYWGGVHLLRRHVAGALNGTGVLGPEELMDNVHDDVKSLEFDPFDSRFYYLTSDGGIWRCQSQFAGKDPCDDRNNNLRVTMFYDIDASQTNPDRMLGGTQDVGTLMYTGVPIWKLVNGGDGLYSHVASSTVLYAQHQFLRQTARCDQGDACAWTNWTNANGRDAKDQPAGGNELPRANTWGWRNAQIDGHPSDPNRLISMGDQVYSTSDGGSNWFARGPTDASTVLGSPPVKGNVTRVIHQPGTGDWVAGTSWGQIWHSDGKQGNPLDTTCPCWDLVFAHPEQAARPAVTSLAFSPVDANVLYATFNIGASKAWTRMFQIATNFGSSNPSVPSLMGAGFPKNLTPQAIAGDGHDGKIAYVGTNQGGVWRWDSSVPFFGGKPWTSFNDGLPPYVPVLDLLVDPVSKELRAATWGRGAWATLTGP